MRTHIWGARGISGISERTCAFHCTGVKGLCGLEQLYQHLSEQSDSVLSSCVMLVGRSTCSSWDLANVFIWLWQCMHIGCRKQHILGRLDRHLFSLKIELCFRYKGMYFAVYSPVHQLSVEGLLLKGLNFMTVLYFQKQMKYWVLCTYSDFKVRLSCLSYLRFIRLWSLSSNVQVLMLIEVYFLLPNRKESCLHLKILQLKIVEDIFNWE